MNNIQQFLSDTAHAISLEKMFQRSTPLEILNSLEVETSKEVFFRLEKNRKGIMDALHNCLQSGELTGINLFQRNNFPYSVHGYAVELEVGEANICLYDYSGRLDSVYYKTIWEIHDLICPTIMFAQLLAAVITFLGGGVSKGVEFSYQ